MATGSFLVPTSNQYIQGRVDYEIISGDTETVVKAYLRVSRTNSGYTTSGSGSFTLSIDGKQNINSGRFTFTHNSNTLVVSNIITIPHSIAGGARDVIISASGSHSGFSMPTKSYTETLQIEGQGSRPKVYVNEVELGQTLLIDIVKAQPHYRHIIKYRISNSQTLEAAANIDDRYYFPLPLSLATYVTEAITDRLIIYIETYDGTRYVGARSLSLNVNIPASMVPTTNKITSSELSPQMLALNLPYLVKGLSKVNIKVEPAHVVLPYGATVRRLSVEMGGITKLGQEVSYDNVDLSGEVPVKVTILDSRGRESSKIYKVTVKDYTPPKILDFKVQRSDASGFPDAFGDYVAVSYKVQVTDLENRLGTSVNLFDLEISSGKRPVTEYIRRSKTTQWPFDILTNKEVFEGHEKFSAYDFLFQVSDRFNSTISKAILPTTTITLALGEGGVAVGKLWERGALDLQGDVYIKGTIYENNIPINDKYLQKDTNIKVNNVECNILRSESGASVNTLNVRSNAEVAGNLVVVGDLTSYAGLRNPGKKYAHKWSGTIQSGGSVNIFHYLGYVPIVQNYDGSGGAGVVFEVVDNEILRAKYWNAGGGSWTGQILLW